jgi:hypothetical protein
MAASPCLGTVSTHSELLCQISATRRPLFCGGKRAGSQVLKFRVFTDLVPVCTILHFTPGCHYEAKPELLASRSTSGAAPPVWDRFSRGGFMDILAAIKREEKNSKSSWASYSTN